jgi:hypothetical protein
MIEANVAISIASPIRETHLPFILFPPVSG